MPAWRPTEYTLDWIKEELEALLKALKDNEEIIYIWELFTNKEYSRQRYSEWIKAHWSDSEVSQLSDTIKDILESRAIKWAMTNKLNATSVIFHLKNNYKWVDKSEIEQKTEHSFPELSQEQLKKIANQVK